MEPQILSQRTMKRNDQRNTQRSGDGPPRTVFGIGGAVIHTGLSGSVEGAGDSSEPSTPDTHLHPQEPTREAQG